MRTGAATAWILLITASLGLATDWPLWRGPNQNGMTEESGWNPAALNQGIKILWSVELGKGHSSTSIQGDRLYTMGNVDNHDVVYCLNTKDGKEVWTFKYPCKPGNYDGPRATPVLDGTWVYTMSRNGLVHAFDAATGDVHWKTDATEIAGQKVITWGLASSPVIEGDLILLNIGEHGVALNKRTGKLAWSSPVGKASYASAVVFDYRGRRCAAIFSSEHMYVVDAVTGKEVWHFEWKTKYDVNAADPVVFGDRMFLSSGYGRGCTLLDISGARPKQLWENDSLRNHFSSSIHVDGYIYGVDGNTKGRGHLRCLSVKDGREQWNMPIGFGSLIMVNDKIVALGESGTLYVAERTPEAYREISKAHTGLSKLCWTPPAFSGGVVYCRNDKGKLVAVDLRQP